MSSNIDLYINKSTSNTANKNITLVAEKVNCVYTDSIDVLNPTIRLKYFEGIDSVNYCYLADTKRYYYVNTIKNVGEIEMTLSVDVLMSHLEEIKQITCTIDRNENESNGYLVDDKYQSYAYRQITCKSYPKGLTHDSLILMTVG